jgi:flagellar hook-associated protein 3 FlgL
MVSRISTASVFTGTIATFGGVQSDMAELTRQISSGRAAKDFKDLGNKTRLVFDLESKLSRTEGQVDGNKLVLIRLNNMNDSMQQLEDIATQFRNNLLTERSGAATALPLADLTKAQLSQVQQALNASVNGRFLFAGTRTDGAPVSDLAGTSNLIDASGNNVLPTSETIGTPSANYYQGDDGEVTVRATDQLTVNYGITADDPAFQKLIGAMHMAIQAETRGDQEELAQAVDLVNEAIDGIINHRNAINNNLQILQSVNELHENFKTYLGQTISEQTGVDIAASTTKLALNQTILQATFQNFARISGLKLVDFLR